MKTLLLCACVLVLASVSLADVKDVKKQLKAAIKSLQEDVVACISENSLVQNDWYDEEQIMTNLHVQSGNEQRTRRCGCTIACVLKRQNVINGSNINEIRMHDLIDNAVADSNQPSVRQLHKVVHKCVKEVKDITDECEKSFAIYICVAKAAHIAEGHEEHQPAEEESETKPEN
ncbi:pheromone-binding protein Gp-9 [Linepithema humile]|uniref:pheromone-binding protein Gp-9 n=1 Tax=Linepithema humile TaxID=83485 RepID=UPI000623B540|nr:PREDICTED: pheromone-binding protein Gp-9-like [Linepithema humile]